MKKETLVYVGNNDYLVVGNPEAVVDYLAATKKVNKSSIGHSDGCWYIEGHIVAAIMEGR